MSHARRRAAAGRRSLVPACFVRRPNRFLVTAELLGGRRVTAHLADPGRLAELLLPGAPLRLRPEAPSPTRRTRYTVALVRSAGPPRVWVSVDTTLPNRLAAKLVADGAVPGLRGAVEVRREVARGRSRFDLAIRDRRGRETVVEVKSVTLVEDGVALFPDAPTTRGARHVRELEGIAREGGRAAVLFVVQRDDARMVAPNERRDPEFAEALRGARRGGVLLRAVRFRLDAAGRARYLGAVPVRMRAPHRRADESSSASTRRGLP